VFQANQYTIILKANVLYALHNRMEVLERKVSELQEKYNGKNVYFKQGVVENIIKIVKQTFVDTVTLQNKIEL
jgi:hypothetical protein